MSFTYLSGYCFDYILGTDLASSVNSTVTVVLAIRSASYLEQYEHNCPSDLHRLVQFLF